MKKTITISDLKNLVNEAHAQVKDLKGGKNANYIPFLDKIDSNADWIYSLSSHGRSDNGR